MRGLPSFPPETDAAAAALQQGLVRVDQVFRNHLQSDLPPVSQLVEHVEHYRGKMLRPILALLSSMAASASERLPDEAPVVGAVVEMVHMATLVHDDVLDEADVRRRGATINRLRGNEAAVILGDYLIASSFHLCSTLPSPRYALEVAAASSILCAGELLQLHHRDELSLDEPTYFEIVSRKTGELVAAACSLGALTGGANAELCAAMGRFGRTIGSAFQIQDDLLDLTGTEAIVGKSVRKDLEKGKLTLPVIHHLAAASPIQRGRSLLLIESAAKHPDRAEAAALDLLAAMKQTDSLAHARSVAQSMVTETRQELSRLAPSPAREMLDLMAQAVVARDF
jgi:octaprenyl-diphosphate synthase